MIRITNGYLIDPKNNLEGDFDLIIDGEKIKAIVKRGDKSSKEDLIVDAKGKWVIPGLIDMHVHLREPGYEWKETIETGVRAAIAGGYTSVCTMPNTSPTNDSAEVTQFILGKAREAGLSRVFPIGAISIGLKGKEMAPMMELAEAGCVAFSDDGEPVWDSALMRRALEWALPLNKVLCLHEEDLQLSQRAPMNESPRSFAMGVLGQPTVAEEVMIARDIELARYTSGKIHICHVSTARGAILVERAKKDGIQITAEVTPHHLLLTEEMCEGYNTNAKMAPPLRTKEDTIYLQDALAKGIIDVIASDHAPHEADRKECEFSEAAFGILGLQTTLPLMLDLVRDGVLTKMRAVEAMSTNPAKILSLKNLGGLGVGDLADVILVDPNADWKLEASCIHSKSFNSPFIGRTLRGQVTDVFIGGVQKISSGSIL